MVELQEFSWLTWLVDDSHFMMVGIFGVMVIFLFIGMPVSRMFRYRDVAALFCLMGSILISMGSMYSLYYWIDVNDSETQISEIEDTYDVSLLEAGESGTTEDFGKIEWDRLGNVVRGSYHAQHPIVAREDDGELRTDAVLILEREDLDDPFTASLAIPEDPESGKTLIDYNTGEPISEKTDNAEEKETD